MGRCRPPDSDKIRPSYSIAARFAPIPSLPPQIPRWLTLTAILQTAAALAAGDAAVLMLSHVDYRTGTLRYGYSSMVTPASVFSMTVRVM